MGSPRALEVPDPAKVRGQALGTWALALPRTSTLYACCVLRVAINGQVAGRGGTCVDGWIKWMTSGWVGGWQKDECVDG